MMAFDPRIRGTSGGCQGSLCDHAGMSIRPAATVVVAREVAMWPTLETLEALEVCATVQDVMELPVGHVPPARPVT